MYFRIFLRSALPIVFAATILGSLAAQAQVYKAYPLGPDGRLPQAGVTIRGDLVYATTAYGTLGGAVYEIKHLGEIVYFGDLQTPGPEARVVFGPDGHLYGTYTDSLTGSFVFNLTPPLSVCKTAAPCWKYNVLYTFKGYPDGAEPAHGDLLWDQQGNIYGTTTVGGSGEYGTVYEMMPPVPPSKTWTERVIWNFTGPDGEYPQNAVMFDSSGNLLGTAKQGGANGFGTIFKLMPSGNVWTETNIYDFQGSSDGQYPIAGLMMDSSGNIYGATSDGGNGGGGAVFELTPSGNGYTFNVLCSFSAQKGNSCGPWATLTMDSSSNLYGTRYCGGANGDGSVFKLTNTPNGWVYSSLHDFPAFMYDGAFPISNVSFDGNGNLWGTANSGNNGTGIVWEITP